MHEFAGEPASIRRRVFLAGVVAAPVVAVGMLLQRAQVPQPVAAALPVPAPAGLGYRETDHVRRYYRSAAYF